VLQLRSVEYARNHGVRIHCRSSFEDGPGTLVVTEEEAEQETVEQPFVTAVTHTDDEARVTLVGIPRMSPASPAKSSPPWPRPGSTST
jgi:aspartate kinase